MMTIEERARRYSNKLVSENSYNGYIAGATEQKVIDEKLMAKLKESWEKESEINHDAAAHYEQGWHDAVKWACKWWNKNARHIISASMRNDFRKYMGELK